MSQTYVNILKKFYPSKYTIDDVRKFLEAGKITQAEFDEIVGTN